MRRSRLDKIDLNILKNLQEDGRITNVNLAKSAGISAPPCLRRVRALEEAGYIDGYNAQLNRNMMGYGVQVFASINLQSQAEEKLVEFENYIQGQDMVRECHMLAGEMDFLLKIVAKNWDTYETFLTKSLASAPNVVSVKSLLSIRTSKNKPGIPMEKS